MGRVADALGVRLAGQLAAKLDSGADADVTVLVGAETFKLHALILKTRSPALARALGAREGVSEVRVAHASPRAFNLCRPFLYLEKLTAPLTDEKPTTASGPSDLG